MKTLAASFLAVLFVAGITSCKDEVEKATECTKASEAYVTANKAYVTSPNKENCLARNTAITVYRTECENLPEGLDSLDCSIYDKVQDIVK